MKQVSAIIATLLAAGGMALAQAGATQQPAQGSQASPAQAQPGQAQPAQSQPAQGQQAQPAQGQAAQGQPPAAGQAAQPAGKPQPQAKTQDEYKAYQEAGAKADPAEAEAAANEFAVKFPQSDLKVFLYRRLMYLYQSANNADKTLDIAKKILTLEPRNPEALVTAAMVLTERTRETDLDKDERLGEATKYAQTALESIDTDLFVPPNADPAQVAGVKNVLRGMAELALGTAAYINKDYTTALPHLQQATTLNPKDPVTWLRLSVVLDAQNKYPDALAAVNKSLEVAAPNSPEANLAKAEQQRLQKLTGGSAPAPKQ